MNKAQEYLLQIGLNDKCIGTPKRTENGEVIVDGELMYCSDLMEYWSKKNNNQDTWHDAKKEFPKNDGWYLIYADGKYYDIAGYNKHNSRWFNHGEKTNYVLAWREIPQKPDWIK